jgi:hypothetical protein
MKWHNNKKINKARNFIISVGIITSIIVDFTTWVYWMHDNVWNYIFTKYLTTIGTWIFVHEEEDTKHIHIGFITQHQPHMVI